MELRTRVNEITSMLRGVLNLTKISNDTIAKLNDLAYKAINKGSLNKLIDKRALNNQKLFEKLENEVSGLVKRMNFETIKNTHSAIAQELGQCPFTLLTAIEAMETGDCFCVGLRVTRPEAAIADASRLVILDVFPSYLSLDSFLESASFQISKDHEAHGGFNNKNDLSALAIGAGREQINGVMPLFLFKEHWEIARRKVQSVYGLMCTLDVMGYSAD